MAAVELVTGLRDPRVRDYVGLTDVALRRRLDVELGLYLAESDKVIRRALQAGHRPRSMLLSTRWLEPLGELVDQVAATGAPVLAGEPVLLEQITGFNVHRGAIASMHRPALPQPAQVLAAARLVAILEDVVDHTNV